MQIYERMVRIGCRFFAHDSIPSGSSAPSSGEELNRLFLILTDLLRRVDERLAIRGGEGTLSASVATSELPNLGVVASAAYRWSGSAGTVARILEWPAKRNDPNEVRRTARVYLAEAWKAVNPFEGEGVGISITHSSLGVAAVVRVRPRGLEAGVGIDLEPSERLVSARLARRIAHLGDAPSDLRPIVAWSAKEACYKAGAAPRFSHIRLSLSGVGEKVWFGTATSGTRQFSVAAGLAGNHVVACALRTD